MPNPKKTFKELVESNPITTLAVIAAAAVTTTFSITSYFHGSEQKIRELEFQRQLSTQKESLDRQVAFLQGRLASVERKLGSEGPSYLDVSTLITTPERTSSLGADFTYFKDLKCYISVPQNEKWTYEIATELKLFGYLFGASAADSVAKSAVGIALTRVPLHLWRGSEQFEVNTGNEDIPKVTLFPFVGIQSFDNAATAQMLGETLQKSQEEKDQSLEAVRELSTKLESTSQQPSPGAKSEQSEIPKSSGDTRLAMTDVLSGIFRSDLAAFMLFGQLSGIFSLRQMFEGTSVQLLTAEKRGNLLYGHILVTFTDFQTKLPVFLDREFFFVSGPTRSFMLVTAAPSDDRRGRGSAWITSWLGSVRIPVE